MFSYPRQNSVEVKSDGLDYNVGVADTGGNHGVVLTVRIVRPSCEVVWLPK